MNKELNLNFELQEISENDLQEINGGYGHWEGHNVGSAAFSAIMSDAWSEFCTEFSKAYSQARHGR
ncbi:hypothetical protein GCM10027347_35060 [Larkinella harenae]